MSAAERAQLVDALARIALDPTETPERRARAAQAVEASLPPEGGEALPIGGWSLSVHHSGGGYHQSQEFGYEGWGGDDRARVVRAV